MVNPPDRWLEPSPENPPIIELPIQAIMPQSEAIEQLQKALKDIYFVSGLGADQRVFRLLKFEGYQPVYIHWVDPEPNEPIADYAKRLLTQIKSDRPIIVGLSFGGILAVEIAKHIEVEKVILISSAKTKFEVPIYFRAFRWFPVHRVFPFKNLLWAGYWLLFWLFSLEGGEEHQLLKAILLDTDADFVKWAIQRVVIWNNEEIPEHLYHMHGSRDRIFPIRFVEPDFVVDKGGHFMIMNRAAQISTLIGKIIE